MTMRIYGVTMKTGSAQCGSGLRHGLPALKTDGSRTSLVETVIITTAQQQERALILPTNPKRV
jgi:hypothetical protein